MKTINKSEIQQHFKHYSFTEFNIETVKRGYKYTLTMYKHHTNALTYLRGKFNVIEISNGFEYPAIFTLTAL